uniref:Uncharacterized protein n=1 Tax=Anguilla anguilla TaxID=7936 RepID=A0A0E9XP37_ANGAN
MCNVHLRCFVSAWPVSSVPAPRPVFNRKRQGVRGVAKEPNQSAASSAAAHKSRLTATMFL